MHPSLWGWMLSMTSMPGAARVLLMPTMDNLTAGADHSFPGDLEFHMHPNDSAQRSPEGSAPVQPEVGCGGLVPV